MEEKEEEEDDILYTPIKYMRGEVEGISDIVSDDGENFLPHRKN